MKQSLLLSFIVLTAVAVTVKPAEVKEFFKGIAKDVLEGVTVDHKEPSVDDDMKKIADILADVIEEDCKSVCPPMEEGDHGAHMIQCVQCIAEEFGAVMFPEFLEAVLAIRSPELLEQQEVEMKAEGSESKEESETFNSLGLDEIMGDLESNSGRLIEELTDAFEEQGISLFKALLGECRDDCASIAVPQSDPAPCLRCMSAHVEKETTGLNFVNTALAVF